MFEWLKIAAIRTPHVAIVLAFCAGVTVYAQYDNEQGMTNHYGGGGYGDSSGYGRSGYSDASNYGGHGGGEYEDRPKINLGFKVKIPAMKFELPRFSLPKITVSARIRQPNKPKTIMLPEINLDTSSGGGNKFQQQNNDYGNGYHHSAHNSGGGYRNFAPSKNTYASPSVSSAYSPSSSAYSPSYNSGGYHNSASRGQRETSYSFSAHEEDLPPLQHGSYGYVKSTGSSYYGNGGAPSSIPGSSSNYGRKQPESQWQTVANTGYSSTNVHPSYLLNSKKIATTAAVSGALPISSTIASSPSFNRNSQYMTSQQLSDVGFNVPVYDEPSSDQDTYLYNGLSNKEQYNAAKIGATTNDNSQLNQQQVSK